MQEATWSSTILRRAWIAVALLWPVALLNYLDRQMMAAMKTSVMTDVSDIISEENWGFMLGLFKWVYAGLSPMGGYLADRFSRRHVIAGSLFVWSMVTYATGHVSTYEQLLWTRALMGISEAFYMPAALALIADFHSTHTRSRAVGFHHSAIYFGIILGGFSGYAADSPDIGWRTSFSAAGLVGIIYALPLLYFLQNPPNRLDQPSVKSSPTQVARVLFTNGSFILLVLYFTLPAIAGWVVKDWMPAILKDRFALDQGRAGVSATLYVNVAALAGVFIGGLFADLLMSFTIRGKIFVSAAGMVLMFPALVGVGSSSSLSVAIAYLVAFGFGWGFFDCNNMPILSQIVRSEHRATAYGIMNFASISGGGFADWGFGRLRDQNVELQTIFNTFASLAIISLIMVLLIRPNRNIESDLDRTH